MRTLSASEIINPDRRQLLSTAAMGIAAAAAASLFPAYPALAATPDEIRPFRINIPEEALVDLRRRIDATRWPDRKRSEMTRKACSWRRAGTRTLLGYGL